MTTTNFPNGVTSFGIPIYGGGQGRVAASAPGLNLGATSIIGNTWFVDTVYGADGNDGNSPQSPLSTMAAAFLRLKSGDVINFRGKITEQLTTPVNVFDVWINGLGNRPRHADATPVGGGYAASQWGAAGLTAATASLRVIQQGWRFTNFLFTAVDTNAACVEICRNAGATDLERDASHAQFLGMRFSGAGVGIRGGVAGVFTEIPFNVEVGFSQFDNMTFAMRSAIECNAWSIHDNEFGPNTNHITMVCRAMKIWKNNFGAFTAASSSGAIDLRGGSGINHVYGNYLAQTYSHAGGYQEGTTDNWYGNYISTGISSALPA